MKVVFVFPLASRELRPPLSQRVKVSKQRFGARVADPPNPPIAGAALPLLALESVAEDMAREAQAAPSAFVGRGLRPLCVRDSEREKERERERERERQRESEPRGLCCHWGKGRP